ncbi:hypothetical protein [Vampirovibrio chlorellavorus]|uniref:hypothetical protein n=1 Tax=Vampirovibrio chlorellavorus TaxID=758823 RepID=UPI0026EEA6AA|nr:hypothetical protein [Vampirovibrio chlorellavorus]
MEGELSSPKSNHPYKDPFLWPLILIPLLTAVSFNIYSSIYIEHEIEAVLLEGFLGLLWLCFISILILFALWHKLRKMTLSLLISLVFWLWITPAFLRWFPVGDYVHLSIKYPEYKAQTDVSPNARLKFHWGTTGLSFTVGSNRTLIYDPSDKLPSENAIKATKWRKASRYVRNGHEYFSDWLVTRHLWGHFYLVEEWHQ